MNRHEFPQRRGEPPLVSGPHPHEQVTQTAPVEIQERLFAWAILLPGVVVGPSYVAISGTRALHLSPALARGPLEAFLAGTEFAHFHPAYDGSMHLTLPKDILQAAVDAGWGVSHPVSGALLLYGPRDETELDVARTILQLSYGHATGHAEQH
ncbi:luciferase family protein [Longispora sp. NPDC051575]|uniref:luciferase domain-containing protein n=1 Tax=Longispora sp. NPDC051575 TaxID=3154943 RepID=UPI00343B919C